MDGGDDARGDRQAIVYRRQLAGVDHRFEHRRFVVLRRGLCSRRLGFGGRLSCRLVGGRLFIAAGATGSQQ